MKAYIEASRAPSSRILIERKETGNFPRNSTAAAAIKEREEEKKYAPQLAGLLLSSSQDFFERTTLGTLPFKGFAKDTSVTNGCFTFAFDYPQGAAGLKPLSLHDLIRGAPKGSKNNYKLSLNDRFQVAKMVSRCLGMLHSDSWLHKRVRSHAVKFFFRNISVGENRSAAVLDTSAPYLTDFGFSRPLDVFSAAQDAASQAVDLDGDVYRHPRRFGRPSDFFSELHDVYSLGVVLLEIGVWKTARQMYDEAFPAAAAGTGAPAVTGDDVKAAFVKRAQDELEHRMGSAYKDAALLCLDGEHLSKHLRKPSFAVEFQKHVVQQVDVALLNPERTEFEDDAPPKYEKIMPSNT